MVGAEFGSLAWQGLFSALLLLLALLGLGVPVVVWIERRQLALIEDRSGFGPGNPDGFVLGGALQIVAEFLKLSSKRWTPPGDTNRFVYLMAPWAVVATGLLAFAVVPIAGRYRLGDTWFSPILTSLEWGILYIVALGSLAGLALVWAGASSGNPWARRAALRSALRGLSSDLALLLAVAPMVLLYGSLSLEAMAAWQDSTVGVWSWLRILVEDGSFLESGVFSIPAWGLLLNPLAFAMFLLAVFARSGLRPFDADHVDAELEGGLVATYSGSARLLFLLSDKLQIILIAALLTLIFLGGWSIPWLPQDRIVDPIEGFVGASVANAVCLFLHLLSFSLKWLAMVFLQVLIRSSMPRYDSRELMTLCWKLIVPLSVLNLFLTAAVLLAFGENPP